MEYTKILWILFFGFTFIGVILAFAAFIQSGNDSQKRSKMCNKCGSKVYFMSDENNRLIIWCDNCNKETKTIEDN